MPSSLYICYFGIDQPLVQTQVLPYLRELVKGGYEMSLLTFEPGEVDEQSVRESLAADGIEWRSLRYHKRPSVPATLFDVANAVRFIRKLMVRRKFDILHARSHVPMMMAALARKASSHEPKILFDIRGFLPEEYVDAGVWDEQGQVYRNFKRVEGWLMNEADGFVVLTERARDILADEIGSRPVQVIPCCVDFDRRFSGDPVSGRSRIRTQLGIDDRFVFVHLGALGGLYLSAEIADFLAAARNRDPRVFGLFLTQSDPDIIVPLLKERGFSESDFYVGKVHASEVEDYLYGSDVGLSFVKASYATASRSPTKIPEYLACGLPVVANAGVGDVDSQLNRDQVGVLIESLDPLGYEKALTELDELRATERLGDVCRESALNGFHLSEIGGLKYKEAYRGILADPATKVD
jgi:glycosyltransferase involved in cell wall biosynthesis